MPVNREAAARGGHTRAARLTPERRQEIARLGALTASVNRIVNRTDELNSEQIHRLRDALAMSQ